MKKISWLIIVLASICASAANAQKIIEGDKTLGFLKGSTHLNLEFDDAWMTVGKENKSEDKYLEEMLAKLNEKKPGKGDRWVEKWRNEKKLRYAACETALNLELTKVNVAAGTHPDAAKYTVRIKIVQFEPGSAGNIKVQPTCKFEITWVDIATGIVQAKGTLAAVDQLADVSKKDYDPINSIKECYSKCGKELGAGMARKMK